MNLTWSTEFPAMKQSFIHNASFCMQFLIWWEQTLRDCEGDPLLRVCHLIEANGSMEFKGVTDSCPTVQAHQMLYFCSFVTGLFPLTQSVFRTKERKKERDSAYWVLFMFLLFFSPYYYGFTPCITLSSRWEGGTLLWQTLYKATMKRGSLALRLDYLTFINYWLRLRLQSSQLEVFSSSHLVFSEDRKTKLSSGL